MKPFFMQIEKSTIEQKETKQNRWNAQWLFASRTHSTSTVRFLWFAYYWLNKLDVFHSLLSVWFFGLHFFRVLFIVISLRPIVLMFFKVNILLQILKTCNISLNIVISGDQMLPLRTQFGFLFAIHHRQKKKKW